MRAKEKNSSLWKFYTHISPQFYKKNISVSILHNIKESDIQLKFMICPRILNKHLFFHQKYIFNVTTSGGKINKYIGSNKLKKILIEYYNPKGFFIKGPLQISNNVWSIELSYGIFSHP